MRIKWLLDGGQVRCEDTFSISYQKSKKKYFCYFSLKYFKKHLSGII